MDWMTFAVTVFCSIAASSGFWAFVQSRRDKNSAETKMLLGLAHDRILALGMVYLERGSISKEEYENLHDYLYKPYKDLGGNGVAKKIMDDVSKLPVKSIAGGEIL